MKLRGINQLWAADIIYIRLQREFVYLAVVLDAFSRRVVGWQLDKRMVAQLPLAALQQALAERKPGPGLVHHSDCGLQYASPDIRDYVIHFPRMCVRHAVCLDVGSLPQCNTSKNEFRCKRQHKRAASDIYGAPGFTRLPNQCDQCTKRNRETAQLLPIAYKKLCGARHVKGVQNYEEVQNIIRRGQPKRDSAAAPLLSARWCRKSLNPLIKVGDAVG